MKILQNRKNRNTIKKVEREAIDFAKVNGLQIDYAYTTEAVDVSPDIFIYRFITKTTEELKKAEKGSLTDLVKEKVNTLLKEYEYPFKEINEASVIFESQENIDKHCDGNAYIYFK